MDVFEKIAEIRSGLEEYSPVDGLARQTMEICRNEPEACQIVLEDLKANPKAFEEIEKEMSGIADEKRKKAKARTGASGAIYIAPEEAEALIRKHFGLPERAASTGIAPAPAGFLNLEDLL